MPVVRSTRRTGRSRAVFAITILGMLGITAPTWAWGRLGHRVIARLADKQLNPKSEGRDRRVARAGRVVSGCFDLGR